MKKIDLEDGPPVSTIVYLYLSPSKALEGGRIIVGERKKPIEKGNPKQYSDVQMLPPQLKLNLDYQQ